MNTNDNTLELTFNNLQIENFRGIKHLEIDDCKRINLLVGKNNSGKTSVLEAISLIVGVYNSGMPIGINDFVRSVLFKKNSEQTRYIFNNLDYNNHPRIITQSTRDDAKRELEISAYYPTQITSIPSLQNSTQNPLGLQYDFKINNEPYHAHYIEDTSPDKTIIQENPNFQESLPFHFVHATKRFMIIDTFKEVIRNQQQREIVEILNIIDTNIKDLTIVGEDIYAKIEYTERLMPIQLTGDGILRLLEILVAIEGIKEQGGVLLIDEIENGLHFSVLEKFWTVIYQAAEKYNVQIFATTHNIETLQYLKSAAEKGHQTFKDNVRVYSVLKQPDGSSKVYKGDYENLQTATENNLEMR